MKSKRKIFITVFILALAGLGGYFAFKTDTVKRQTAKLMKVEFIPNQDFDINQTLSVKQKDSVYKNFRKRCPFHFQMLGLEKFSDSSYLFIASEPAHFVKPDSMLKVFQKYNIHAEIKTHPVGYDGWVKDMLICVGRATTENITNLTKDLNKVLYLSDYKSYAVHLPLDTSRVYYGNKNLNYRIALSEINQWFITDKEAFVDLPDTAHVFDVPSVLKNRKTGVFYSRQPGFVIWSIDKKKDMSLQQAYIRKFALDADLILGAISDSATLVVIGRERESSVMELPPLNVETILLLASIKDGELSQSLDINDILAGKMTNDKDWCPTYLSPQLEHTEFGHLLTITDILLKDWSENGTLRYDSYAYPKPPYYPFDRPLFSKLGLNQLVYNWNTANTMFAYDYDKLHLYALNRTGSLPVSYFNSQNSYVSVGHGYENTAYNYFSGLCNTDLIRVVQYTSLYQLFIDNNISCKDSANFAKGKPYLLYNPVRTLLTNIKNLTPSYLDTISKEIGNKNYIKYHNSQLMKQIADWERINQQTIPNGRKDEIIRDAQAQNRSAIRSELSSLQSQLKGMDEQNFTNLCKYLSYPRGTQLSNVAIGKIYRIAYHAISTVFTLSKPNLNKLGVDLASVKDYYSNSLRNNSSPWMKTPSLIISYNSPRLTGGHNLSSKIRRVNSINADKAIVASGRPQYVPRNEEPVYSSSPATEPQGKAKPRTTAGVKAKAKQAPSTPPSGAPARKRSEVFSGTGRTHRGF